jgi:hypothetical protein
MPEQVFNVLRTELLESGIAPKHVRRIVAELNDHLQDLRAEAMDEGRSGPEADAIATRRIGDTRLIAEHMRQKPELKTWIYRYPRIACLYLPLAYALLLPAAPVFAGLANPAKVARWGTALMLSAGVTATMMLCMQLAIVLT